MQPYSEFRPTAFDASGLCADRINRADWLVAPVSIARESGVLSSSNWEVFVRDLPGKEGDGWEIHRFGHWAIGWFEVILIDPENEAAVKHGEECEAALSSYPVLDDEHYACAEEIERQERWSNSTILDRIWICQRFGISILAARHDYYPSTPTGSLEAYLSE